MNKPKETLLPQMARFVAEYLIDKNATQAATRAGYKHGRVQGHILLQKPHVKAAVEKGLSAQLEKVGLTSARVIEEISRVALMDFREFFDEHGNLKRINDMTADQAACLAGVEIVVKNLVAGDGKVDMVHKVKAWDKVRALELLAKYFKLLTDKVEVTADDELIRRLTAARGRIKSAK
jgi:phage terminase small subunit